MNPYFEQTILNADPIDLTRMVYQRAIACVRNAREHLKNKNIAERSAAIMQAYASLAELLGSLRPEKAPEMCARLQGLYTYMQQRLLDANMQQADHLLAEVLGLLQTLEEAWAGVAAKLAPRGVLQTGLKEASGTRAADRAVDRWSRAGHEETARLAISA